MVHKFTLPLLAACAAGLCLRSAWGQEGKEAPAGAAGTFSGTFNVGKAAKAAPPYQFILRSRSALVTPDRNKNAQTGGGYIQVIQVESNQVLVLMRGSVAAGTGFAGSCHTEGTAAMQMELDQDFEVVPMRAGLRPPRMILSAWLIGSLVSTREKPGGTAEHSPACAVIEAANHQPFFNVCIKPHGVSGGQNALVNDRVGPIEMTVVPGGYHLHQTLAIRALQPKVLCHSGAAAAADFDPDPRLDSRWNEVLKPFRAAPHRDFGFRIILQVLEEPEAGGVVVPGPEPLPRPTKEEQKTPPETKPLEP